MSGEFRSAAVELVVPGTSANLGPGFDSFGLALGIRDHVTAQVTDDPGILMVVEGEGEETLPRDERHLVARAVLRACAAMEVEAPGIVIRCQNSIFQGRGLGSSAAAIVAGILLARALVVDGTDRLTDGDVLDLATRMEGHPDNVAAALLGGFTTAWMESNVDDLHARAVSRQVHPDITPVIFVPPNPMSTNAARRMLSESVAREDAVFNIARASLLVHALTIDPSLLFTATEDRLHQDARASAYPTSAELVRQLRQRGVAAAISGAGPSVLALTSASAADAVLAEKPDGWRVVVLTVDGQGAQVRHRGP